ncbi:MAG TPA: KpsF/GutQ family sugar-phosphate isomerase [Candidatus Solibacter sp.]|nr:KpsF/GutQ family sugar-phosphate isomerase [Candidatus Solibacter sp.]
MTSRDSLASARRVLRIEAQAIEDLLARIDTRFHDAVELLFDCKGRVVVTGMGKSGLIGRKVAATLASTGTPASFLHPAEALHGDVGMLLREDTVLAISYSGENEEVLLLLETIKRLGCPLVTMTGKLRSTLAAASNLVLDVSVKEEACSLNLAPTASTTACIVLGDALAIALMERRGFNPEDFAALHPAGHLGRKLRRVSQVMHSGDDCPRVLATTKIPDVIYEMSKKGLGMTTVVDAAGRLVGILTDGDLRRLMASQKGATFNMSARDCMTPNPVTVSQDEVASAALNLMEQRRITSVVVADTDRRVLGVVHIHDLWTLQLF